MTDDDVHGAVVQWLAGLTDLTVIKAHQSGPTPELPYAMINLTGVAEVRDHPQIVEFTGTGQSNDEGEQEISAAPVIETEWRFSVHSYGPEPTQILRRVRSAVHLAQKNEPLMAGLVVHETSTVRNVPDYVNEAWQPRAQMDLFIRGLTRDGFVVDVIDEAPVDIERAH